MTILKHALRLHGETLGILSLSVLLAAAVPATVFLTAQVQDAEPVVRQTESATAGETQETAEEARARTGAKPKRLTKDERDRLEAESKLREEVGRQIDSLRESQGDAIGQDVSFEELRAQALQRLNIAASALDSPAPADDGGHNQDAGDGGQFDTRTAQHLVCFRADGSVTDQRDECAENQSGFFGFAAEEQEQEDGDTAWHGEGPQDGGAAWQGEEHGSQQWQGTERWEGKERWEGTPQWTGTPQWNGTPQWQGEEHRGFSMPSDDDMASRMRQRFVGSGGPSHAAPQGGGGMNGDFMPPEMMTSILTMMDKMIAKLPKVIAIFEDAGIPIAPEAREASKKATALYRELRDGCGQGKIDVCIRMQEVGMILETGMRPPMEKAVMASGQWQIGMQIGALMSEGMEDMGPMHGAGSGPPSGYGPPPGYGQGPSGFDGQGYGPPSGYDGRMDGGGYGGPPPWAR